MKENIELNEGALIARRADRHWLDEEAGLIPLSHLSLDVDMPLIGWLAFFAKRGIEVLEDDLGRSAVRREVLGELLSERREREAKLAVQAAERAAAQSTPPAVGVPALEHGSPFEAMVAAGGVVTPAEEFGRGGRSVFTELLDQELEAGARQQAAARAEAEAKKAARG